MKPKLRELCAQNTCIADYFLLHFYFFDEFNDSAKPNEFLCEFLANENII